MERLRIPRVSPCHRSVLSCREVEQPEIGLMMPDTELSVVGERVAKETSVIGRTGEGYRLMLRLGIDNGVYTIAELTRCRIEIDTTEIVADLIELITALRKGAGCAEIERTAVSREYREGLIDRVLLEQG